MTATYVIGVDAGATKTEAVIADLEGRPVGAGRRGCGNWEVVGEASATETIASAIRAGLDRAGVKLSQVRRAHIGLAGLDWPDDEPRLRGPIERLLPGIAVTLENDAYLGARACAPRAEGTCVSAGSGVCAAYLGPNGQRYSYGYFGELGGGFPVDQLVIQAVIRGEDGRGPKTALTPAVLEATGFASVADLLRAMTRDSYSLSHTVIRPSVFRIANEGDKVAVAVVKTFGRELALLATNLLRKFELVGSAPNVVASGSLFTRTLPLLFETFRGLVHETDSSAWIKLNDRPPVAGAVRAALHACGVETNGSWETTSSTYEGALNEQ